MNHFERTALQAVVGQKSSVQLRILLSVCQTPSQQKPFALNHLCSQIEKINPVLVDKSWCSKDSVFEYPQNCPAILAGYPS